MKDMKKTFIIGIFAILGLAFVGCGEESIVPSVDTRNEYAQKLEARKDNYKADALIWNWYEKYHSSFVYDFTDEEFHWLWASVFSDTYEQFDLTNEEDREKLDAFTQEIEDGFISKYTDERLSSTLPFRIFLCKKLNPQSSSFSAKDTIATTNGQDAIVVAYEGRSGQPFNQQELSNELSKSFALFFFDKLPKVPVEFIESRTECKFNLVTVPTDGKVEGEFTTTSPISTDKNSFAYKNHKANVCGFIRAYLPTYVQVPTEKVDFADYLAFLTCNSSDHIRKYCQNYWRIAKRSSIFLKYWKENLGEDLIQTHREKFPDEKDPLTERDFMYVER